MARLDTTHIEVHQEPSRAGELVHDVVASMKTAIDNRPLEILAADHIPVISLDRRLIKLALKQLLDNSLKYSPPDSPVAIRVRANSDAVSIDVTDHGLGIAPEDRRRIFERFYRAPSVRPQIPGSGLGLNIAYSIARAHRGDLTVTSQPGETTFRMTLPFDKGGPKN
jgi:signal transduction histidine kinase